jgi:hypothetical protein
MPVYPDLTLDKQQRECGMHMLRRLESWGLGAIAEKLTTGGWECLFPTSESEHC